MAWSRRRKSLVLALAVLVLAALVPMWFKPVSPLRNAYDQIHEGMNFVQVSEVLEQCGCSNPRSGLSVSLEIGSTEAQIHILTMPTTLTYEGADGETLAVRCEGLLIGFEHGQRSFVENGNVVGKEYHSGIELKLRRLWERIRRMLHW
jgi:hypothetical protein